MKKSAILLDAKYRLLSGGSTYICFALDKIVQHHYHDLNVTRICYRETKQNVDELREWINSLLHIPGTSANSYISLSGWIKHHYKIRLPGWSDADKRDKMMETRVAWLEWMIAYWQQKEQL